MRVFSGRAGTWCLIMLLTAASAFAGQGLVSIQKVGGLISGTTVAAGANVRFLIKFTNDTGEKCDVSNGFKLSSPDGAVWDSTTMDSIGPIDNGGTPGDPSDDRNIWFNKYFDIAFGFLRGSADGQGEDTVGCLAAGSQNKTQFQLPITWNDSVYAVTAWFNGKKTSAGKHICIDTAYFQPGGTWFWVGKSLTLYYPPFQGVTPAQPYSDGNVDTRLGSGYCFDIYAPALVVPPPQLSFSCLQGNTPPANQTFTVTSTGDVNSDFQNFTLVESSPWIIKSPSSGTTPKTITVSINPTGLAPGVYVDSIQVNSPTVGNSPQWEKITLTVIAPAPTISLNKSSMTFVGVTGGSNPPSQSFIVKNTGGGVLHWSASSPASWISLVPGTGVDSGQVTVNIDITGLSAGPHSDVITVSDAAATNSPQTIAVNLTLGSNLPFIQVDSQVNHIIVDSHVGSAGPRAITVRNGGIGALSFTFTENSPRIFTLTPSSGSAPQTVSVGFKLVGYVNGNQFWDTLWVNSPEATNSPYPVVFYFKIVDTPAVITVSQDTLRLTSYECSNGLSGFVSKDSFIIYNSGGDAPLNFHLSYETSLATITPDDEQAPFLINADVVDAALPPGVYYDTILVTAINAINSPVPVIIKYSKLAQDFQPQIVMERDSFIVPRQEQTGNLELASAISNLHAGCMPWTLTEAIPWLTTETPSGNVPGAVKNLVNVDALTRGIYRDTFTITAPLASNSPKKVAVVLNIWRLHGDMNWDGIIDLRDLSLYVVFMTGGVGGNPRPEYAVGDVNCSGIVDLADVSMMVSYLTGNISGFCGNP
jgi:hypothetical protein